MILVNVWASLVKYVKDKYPSWEYIDWEDHANIEQLPASDCVGLNGLGAIADDETDTFSFSIAFSTWDDKNLFRLRAAIAAVYEDLRHSGKSLTLYDADSGLAIGKLVITAGTVLAPMGRAEARPYQLITATLKVALGS